MSEVDYTTIPAANRQCIVCGKDLVVLHKHPSVLKVTDEGAPERRDICKECWDKISEDKDFHSFWMNQREAPKPDTRRTKAQQRLSLMHLFEQYLAGGDPSHRPHLYVLAHILMKQRQLVWVGSERDENGVEHVVFKNAFTGDIVKVPEVVVDDEAMVAIKREIDAVMAVDALQNVEESPKEAPETQE